MLVVIYEIMRRYPRFIQSVNSSCRVSSNIAKSLKVGVLIKTGHHKKRISRNFLFEYNIRWWFLTSLLNGKGGEVGNNTRIKCKPPTRGESYFRKPWETEKNPGLKGMSSENGAYRRTSNIGECSYGSCLRIRWVETTSKFYRSRINFPDRSSFSPNSTRK